MGVNISYMGTKKELASAVTDVIDSAQRGTVLDVFSGMCSVGEAVAPKRQVWTNDVQVFSHLVGAALFTSGDDPLRPVSIADVHFDNFESHRGQLCCNFAEAIAKEKTLINCADFDSFQVLYGAFKVALTEELSKLPTAKTFSLFTRLYPDTFFGLTQVIEIDSIVASIKNASTSLDQRRWLIIGLGRAMLRLSNSTGHFAQYLKPKVNSFRTFLRQRRRSVWTEWLSSADEMAPVGDCEWRKKNCSFNQDTLRLLPELALNDERPSVVYADPPYTDDQYSRYYHLLETLVYYDYPSTSGAGRYRASRFHTPFSIKSKAAQSLNSLIELTAATGADLVLSYPTNGLLYEVDTTPDTLLRKHFRKVERCLSVTHSHSTFGASKGAAKSSVEEQIYLGRQ